MKTIVTGIGLAFVATLAQAEPSLERGRYLVEGPAGCGNCHTPMGPQGFIAEQNLAGRLVEKNPGFTAISANITPGGDVAGWTDAELVRAIREGIRPDGSVIGPPMPIVLYRGLSDDDAMSMVMYLRTVPAVDNDPGESVYNIPLPPTYGPPLTTVSAPPQGVTVDYGAYLAGPVAHCLECHTTFGEMGPMFDTHLGAGGFEFHGPWGTSVAANITSHPDGLAGYSDEELAKMITQGVRPDGSAMLPPMPYGYLAKMTADDLAAVILYLRSIPPLPDPS
ncbi:cytochrome C [Maliponia aquimaris]|uniref:Fructose dehydrogenase cytochrome subunit n=1 Tax=Maliponia aquimaris TaxID=1673631 RepID=A0A238L711_9RHOB|nr:cytochrome C [Maliponia aquimaris]SMX50874.1 Fructose dehydrogenase cytochrome subunit precursor [Maliponia aquimaris]